MTNTAPHAVFLSYASQDTGAAVSLAETLRAGGVEVWLDTTELRGGDQWDQKIRRQIRECALFVPLISATTQAREEGYFRREWKQAVERTHDLADDAAFLIPVVIDNVAEPDARVPDAFRRVQWSRLAGGVAPPEFVERLRGLLHAKSGQPSVPRYVTPPVAQPATPPVAPSVAQSAAPPSTALRPARRPSLALSAALAVAVLGLGYAAWLQLRGWSPATSAPPPAPPVAAPAPVAEEQSVAVLPFLNESSDKEQDYFADGLTEEMINLLGKVPDLRVPSRSASFFFKGRNERLAAIAAQLKVANVLEGSVRKAGNRLRISAQLVRADTGYQLWSDRYDRDAKDIFKMQDEISAAVVSALKLKLAAGVTHAKIRGTTNTEAYNQYLIGAHFESLGTTDGYKRAVVALRKAIDLDPTYARAGAKLVLAEAYVAELTADAAGLQRAIAHAEDLVRLNPQDSASYRVRGSVRSSWQFDWAGAIADADRSIELDPSDPDAYYDYGLLLSGLGDYPRALAMIRKAVDLEPLDVSVLGQVAFTQIAMKDWAAAEATLERMLEVDPQSDFTYSPLAALRLLQGRAEEASAACQKILDPRFKLPCSAEAEHSLGHAPESQRALDELLKIGANGNAAAVAETYAWLGQPDDAFDWLNRGYRARQSGIVNAVPDRLMDSLHRDPRWNAFLTQLNLPADALR